MVQQSISAVSDAVSGLEGDAEGARIVREELKLLAMVLSALDSSIGADVSAARGRALDEGRLLELRDEVAVAKPEDLPALFEQMHHLGALRAQRGRSISGSLDRASPYFGHMRLEEAAPVRPGGARRSEGTRERPRERRRDVLIGSRSYVDSGEGIRIVDWRNAPVSRLYYRYGEGDDYEEEPADRLGRRDEVVLAGAQHSAGRARTRRRAAGHVRPRQRRPVEARGDASRSPRDRAEMGGADWRTERGPTGGRCRRRRPTGQAPAADRRLVRTRSGSISTRKSMPACSSRFKAVRAAARRRSGCIAWPTWRSARR